MNDDEVLALIANALSEAAPHRDFGALTLETQVSDLRLDSIEFLQMMCAVEDVVGHQIPHDVMMRVRTLADVVPVVRGVAPLGPTLRPRF